MLDYGLAGICHGLEEVILICGEKGCEIVGGTCIVDEQLAAGGSETDGHILQCAAEAAHDVTLEVGEDHHGVIIGEVSADIVVLEVDAVLYGDGHFTLLVHDVAGGDVIETVVTDGLPVDLAGVSAAGIGCVAFADGTLNLVYEAANERGLQEVVAAGLAGGYFYCGLALEFNAESFVKTDEPLGGNIAGEKYFGHMFYLMKEWFLLFSSSPWPCRPSCGRS